MNNIKIFLYKYIMIFLGILISVLTYMTIVCCDLFLYGCIPNKIETSIASILFSIIVLIMEYEDISDYTQGWLWDHTHKITRK